MMVVLVAVAGFGHAAFADNRDDLSAEERARKVEQLAGEGAQAYNDGDYEEAIELFEDAYELEQVPNLVYNIAKSYEKMEDYDRAVEHYREFAISPDVDSEARASAIERIERLREIADLRKEEVDQTRKAARQAEAGEEPTAAEQLPKRDGGQQGAGGSTAHWWALGSGVALLGAGTGFGLAASSSADLARNADTYDERRAAADSGPTRAIIADGFLVAGAAASALGLYLYFTGDDASAEQAHRKATFSPWVSGESTGLGMSLDF